MGAGAMPDPDAIALVPNHLVGDSDGIIGRQDEAADITALLARFRLVTLTGAAGVGKSCLAALVARQAGENAGVSVVVDLAQTTARDARSLVSRKLRSGRGAPGRELLIVLDNVEHVVDAIAGLVFELLRTLPGARFLVTSREPLSISGERCRPIRPLAVPEEDASNVMTVASSPAVGLFCRRARAVRSDFRLTAKTAASVAELCRRLDGLPLALELAAAKTRDLSPRQITDQLDSRFELLAGTTVPHHRHAGFRQALDWSVDRLSDSDALLLRRLSVFSGGWTLDAATAVCSDRRLPVVSVLEVLAALVAKSVVEADTVGEGSRYRLLETIRAYAGSQLVESQRTDGAHRHATWFASLAVQAGEALLGPNQQPWLDRVTAELGNLRGAQASALQSGDAVKALELGTLLAQYFWSTGRPTEGLRSLRPVIDLSREAAPRLRARSAWVMGLLAGELQLPERDEALATAMELYSRLDDTSGLARTMLAVGSRSPRQGADAEHASALEESEALARVAGDWWCVTQALVARSVRLLHRGEPGEARRIAEEAVAISTERDDKHGLQSSSLALGELELHSGQPVGAERRLEGARHLARERHDVVGVGWATLLLARLADARGDDEESLALAEEALELARDTSTLDLLAAAHIAVGRQLLAAGSGAGALKHFDDAAVASEHALGPRVAPMRWRALALAAVGEFEDARRALNRCLRVSRAEPDQLEIAASLAALAEFALQQGDDVRAKSALYKALAVQNRSGDVPGLIETVEQLGEIAVAGGAVEHGARLLAAAQSQRAARSMPLPAPRRRRLDEALRRVGQALPPEKVASSLAEGAALTLDEAVGYAAKGHGVRGRPALGQPSLTVTEYAVACLAADGLTNVEIAQRLLVSPGTVKSHLGHVFAKLGVTSRVKLAREMTELKR